MDEISRAVGARPGFDRPSIAPLRCLSRLYARTMSALNADPAYSEPLAFEVAAAALQLTAASAQAQTRCSPRDSRRMVETARHLERHYAEPLTLSELASNVNLTRAHFLRMFKVTIGTTPHQFVLRLRLRAAAQLLLDASNTVTSVAHAAGFQDLSNFTRSFVAEFGCPPSHYRHAYSHRGCRNNV
jgi:transcriptional regulator GlxA family with amidase domain